MNNTLKILSDLSQISEVERFITEFSDQHRFQEGVYGNILIAVTEAVTNAILHGNQNDIIKQVEISFQFSNPYVQCFISDQGAGFDYQIHNLNSDAVELLLQPHGRGLFIMRQLSDRLTFHKDGSCVELEFNIQAHA